MVHGIYNIWYTDNVGLCLDDGSCCSIVQQMMMMGIGMDGHSHTTMKELLSLLPWYRCESESTASAKSPKKEKQWKCWCWFEN